MLRFAVLFLLLLAGLARAEGLTAEARQRIAADRVDFLDAAATAIAWFGDPRGLDAAAIDDFIAAKRAARRADVYGLLLAADLSADGWVSQAEVARLAPGLSPQRRGRLIARAAAADGDGDGRTSPAELAAFAAAEALRLVPDKDRDDLRLMLLFDADGDGWVSFAEVQTGIADIAA